MSKEVPFLSIVPDQPEEDISDTITPFISAEERQYAEDREQIEGLRSSLQEFWTKQFSALDPLQSDVMWRVLSLQSHSHIAAELGLTPDEVTAIRDTSHQKLGGHILFTGEDAE